MTLKKYRQKRDFKKTNEPKGKSLTAKKSLLKKTKKSNKKIIKKTTKKVIKKIIKPEKRKFVIQKHAASHLHYDLRLELKGVLKSWAVPKEPSLDPKVKRLAIEVEDHPLEYGSFEGTIPKGQYGAGTVVIWDKGTWESLNPPYTGYKKGDLTFELKGKKLKGTWKLIKIKSFSDNKKNNWLFFKVKDKEVKITSKLKKQKND